MTAARLPDPYQFNLAEIVQRELRESTSADPRVSAERVVERLTAKECRLALMVTLPDYVRNIAGSMDRPQRKATVARLTTPDRIRAWYAQTLATHLFNGAEWKFLRDCTAEDLHGAAAERFKAAERTAAEAERLVKLANLVEERGVAVVGDLSEADLKSVLVVA